MSEYDWLTCTSAYDMLDYLHRLGKTSSRKSRLVGCAFCRRFWYLFEDELRQAVNVAEQHADGLVQEEEVKAAREALWNPEGVFIGLEDDTIEDSVAWAARGVLMPDGRAGLFTVLQSLHYTIQMEWAGDHKLWVEIPGTKISAAFDEEWSYQCGIIREIFGNPCRPVMIDPVWLTWNRGAIAKLARSIYDDGAFDTLPILADALEEAGCLDGSMLSHCRLGKDHVPGCWVIDLLLGKE